MGHAAPLPSELSLTDSCTRGRGGAPPRAVVGRGRQDVGGREGLPDAEGGEGAPGCQSWPPSPPRPRAHHHLVACWDGGERRRAPPRCQIQGEKTPSPMLGGRAHRTAIAFPVHGRELQGPRAPCSPSPSRIASSHSRYRCFSGQTRMVLTQ